MLRSRWRPPRPLALLLTLLGVAVLAFVIGGGVGGGGKGAGGVGGGGAGGAGAGGSGHRAGASHRQRAPRPVPTRSPTAASVNAPARTSSRTIGYSVDHRAIRLVVVGDPRSPHPTLVVGCIHGNETAGIAIARRLAAGPAPRGTALWIVLDLNPDGLAAGTRQNAHGVDLNRNFPYRWRPQYAPGDSQYAGPGPLSEPESRLAHALILRLAPRLAIWFHQPQGLTDRSGGDPRVEQRFATLSGLPLHQLTRYPGSATTWEDHRFSGGTAFVVELPPGRLSRAEIVRHAHAVLSLAGETGSRPAAPPSP